MNDLAMKGAFADLLPAPKPTLRELALLAVRANKAASKHLHRPDPWTVTDEREQARLDDAAQAATQAMLRAFEAAGFDRQLLADIGQLAL